MLDVIARHIAAVTRKLNSEPVKRRAVITDQIAFHQTGRLKPDSSQTAHGGGIKIAHPAFTMLWCRNRHVYLLLVKRGIKNHALTVTNQTLMSIHSKRKIAEMTGSEEIKPTAASRAP